MKNYINKIIAGLLIIGSLIPSKALSLEQIVNQSVEAKTEVKADSIQTKKVKTRKYDLNANFLLNEIVRGGSFSIKGEKERFINEKDIGWNDYFTLSYDYTALNKAYGSLLERERIGKEKKLWIIGYHVSYKKKPFIDLEYSSDGSVGIYSTFLTGGLGKGFSNGLSIEGGFGLRTGNLDFKKEKYDVFNLSIGYKTPNKNSNYRLDTVVKAYLPRKLTNDLLSKLWLLDAKSVLFINKKIFGLMIPTFGLNFRRDYLPVIEEEKIDYIGIIRFNGTIGFNVTKGGEVK